MLAIFLITACATIAVDGADQDAHNKVEMIMTRTGRVQHQDDHDAHNKKQEKLLMRRIQKFKDSQESEDLFEKEESALAPLVDERISHPPKDKTASSSMPVAWDLDDFDQDSVLDELEALTYASSFKAKHDPPPENCVWNSWTKKGSCRPTAAGSCGVSGEQEYSRTNIPEQWGGKACTGSTDKTESGCALPQCPPTPAPTPAATVPPPPPTTTMAGGQCLHVGFATFMGLFTVVLWHLR